MGRMGASAKAVVCSFATPIKHDFLLDPQFVQLAGGICNSILCNSFCTECCVGLTLTHFFLLLGKLSLFPVAALSFLNDAAMLLTHTSGQAVSALLKASRSRSNRSSRSSSSSSASLASADDMDDLSWHVSAQSIKCPPASTPCE